VHKKPACPLFCVHFFVFGKWVRVFKKLRERIMGDRKRELSKKIIAAALVIVLITVIAYVAVLGLNPKEKANISVSSPLPNEKVTIPFKVKGEARVFENTVLVRLKDESSQVLFFAPFTAQAPEAGSFGPFEAVIDKLEKAPSGERVFLEVFWTSPKDGSELDLVSIPLRLEKAASIP